MHIEKLLVGLMLVAVVGCAPQKVQPVASSIDTAGRPAVSEAFSADTRDGQQPAPAGKETGAGSESGLPAEPEAGTSIGAPEPPVKFERAVSPNVLFVDQRMMVYGDKLSSWEALAVKVAELGLSDRVPSRWNECLATIEGLFRDYSVLMETLLTQDQPVARADQFAGDPAQIFQEDITFLEGGCEQAYGAGAALVGNWDNRDNRPPETEVQDSESLVTQYVEAGRYEDAITAFQAFRDSRPGQVVNPDIWRLYGLALLRTGKFELAGEVLAGAVENMQPSPEERSLRRLVADLLLASGSLAEARGHYRRLADFETGQSGDRWVADQLALLDGSDVHAREFALYREVLKGYLSSDGRHIPPGMKELAGRMENEAPGSFLSDQAQRLLGRLEDSVRGWVAGRVAEIDVLVANNEYGRAKVLLEQMPVDELPAAAHGIIRRAMDDLLQAELKYQEEQRVIGGKSLSAQWDKAVRLLDSQKYDQAIEAFTQLFYTEYDVPARATIQKAAETASVEMRRKSANIFVQARKEGDHERKKKLFRESWQLIYDITIKYPEVKLIDKVKQNLAIIEKHIEIFDPSLLQELKAVSGSDRNGQFQ